ncbi:hypothetical protein [Parendozoicomonas haliclonae]|nr:hypothetical protein [Parendozoicomonas haliclonae]
MEFETPMDCMFFEHTVTFIQSLGRVNTYYPRLVAPLRLVKDIGDRSTQPRSPTTVLLFRLNTTKEFPLNPLKRKGTFEENSDGIKTLRLTPPDEDEIKVEGEGENNHDPNMQVDSPDSDSETESL